MKASLIIIGAGLGGCILAESVCSFMDVTIVELPDSSKLLNEIDDLAYPANLNPHIGSGLGGTTQYWHNGLMQIDADIFSRHWPFPKSTLDEYYQRSFEKLSKTPIKKTDLVFEELRQRYIQLGIPACSLKEGLFYPNHRINVWESSNLNGRVKLIRAEVIGFEMASDSKIEALQIKSDEIKYTIAADMYILSAGGIGTPLLLQELARKTSLPALQNAGKYYEDHPTGFVAEIQANKPFYRFWNYKSLGVSASFRIPMAITEQGFQVSFQLRPAYQSKRENHFISLLSDLRNHPLRLKNYFKLLFCIDDLFEIISFKLGFNFPTRHFSVLMVAEQSASTEIVVEKDNSMQRITRKWTLTSEYFEILDQALEKFLKMLGPGLIYSRVFLGWHDRLASSAHHSGTARMGFDAKLGVCDQHGLVFGMDNLYISDGSMIPASGYANTGLTIAALSMKLGDYLKKRYVDSRGVS